MRHIYDLQLDREITARREYELNVEAQLRRQLSVEVRAEAADELAALRAEVAALRSNLEIMLGTDLGIRPALEAETVAMAMPSRRDGCRAAGWLKLSPPKSLSPRPSPSRAPSSMFPKSR